MNDCLMFQIGVSEVCMVGTGIIVHQNKFLTDRTRIWPHKLIENRIAVLQCLQCNVFNSFPLKLMPFQTMTEPLP